MIALLVEPPLQSGDSEVSLTLYTIGHSNLSLVDFLARLYAHNITTLIDVRSKPYSRYVPHFNKNALEWAISETEITYRYAGAYLGGLPSDPSQLTPDGRADYAKIKASEAYVKGIVRLLNLLAQNQNGGAGRVAIMCAEADPRRCHRHKLIARSLIDPTFSVLEGQINLNLQHINAMGELDDPLTPQDFAAHSDSDPDPDAPQQLSLF